MGKRYECANGHDLYGDWVQESPDGDHVRYEDYERVVYEYSEYRKCVMTELKAANALIRKLEDAVLAFWKYSRFVLPMPVHPAVGALMEIGKNLELKEKSEKRRIDNEQN